MADGPKRISEMSGSEREELDLFYQEVRALNAWPLWEPEEVPQPKTMAYIWPYETYRPLLHKAARIVPMESAPRRVLVFSNPGLLGRAQATNTLLANLQIINPGEIAPTHRHTAAALRLIVEGSGAYTAVDGEKSSMEEGDFVTTPNWTWHDHGHEGKGPMVWLDGLDVPMVTGFEAFFMEQYERPRQDLTKPDELSIGLYGKGAMRPTWVKHQGSYSPLLNYKFAQAAEHLRALAAQTDGGAHDGIKLEYVNPVTGGPALPTMACSIQLLRRGEHTQAHRHTGGTVYHVISGRGESVIDGVRFAWGPKDTFVVPGWSWHEHIGGEEAYLFSYTDEPVLANLDLVREEAYAENGGFQKVTGDFAPLPGSVGLPGYHHGANADAASTPFGYGERK